MSKEAQDTLYFDGRCDQCSTEMRILKKWKDSSLTLVDVHQVNTSSYDIDKNDLLSVLHLKNANGVWVKGLDANVRAWRHTPFGWILIPLRWPLIRNIADFAYYRWAEKRACRLGYKATQQQ